MTPRKRTAGRATVNYDWERQISGCYRAVPVLGSSIPLWHIRALEWASCCDKCMTILLKGLRELRRRGGGRKGC